MKIKPCPNCGDTRIWTCVAGFKPRYQYWCECSECHWCGKTGGFKITAKLLWNREASENHSKDRLIKKQQEYIETLESALMDCKKAGEHYD